MIEEVKENLNLNSKRIILESMSISLTGSELQSKATQLTKLLQSEFRNDQVIPILVGRNPESVIAILACLIIGKTFAPISSAQPQTRINSCLKTLGIGKYLETQEGIKVRSVKIDNVENQKGEFKVPQNSLYCLFTSGSTGTPKGVIVSSDNLINTILWSLESKLLNRNFNLAVVSTLSFDIGLFDVLFSLYSGSKMSILSNPSNLEATLDEIKKYEIQSMFSAPMFYSQFVMSSKLDWGKLQSLHQIISGGDFFPPTHIKVWHDKCPNLKVFNVWGPTETSVVNTAHELRENDLVNLSKVNSLPIGKSSERMIVKVVRENGDLCLVREEGELIVIGDAVSQGYLGATADQESKFFVFQGKRAFRTGDLGYVDETGNLFMIGRKTGFMKINGYRIDPLEIEIIADGFPGIDKSCAFSIDKDEGSLLQLVIQLKADLQTDYLIQHLKSLFRDKLPQYMIPKNIHIIENLPLNENGKIDRKKIKEIFS